ncbi:MAG TPA: class I SAM-dependent methyltransferase [Noviherbaspirillum sp.]
MPPTLENTVVLPDLTKIYPDKYFVNEAGMLIYLAPRDEDFALIESMIMKHRYYDSLGVWAPKIDLDKRVTASIVEGLGARSCLELGCFSGSVLSLLAERSIDVCGVEVSHRAFMLAYPNIYQNIRFGNFLDLKFDRSYDLILCMDILEHVSPLSLDHYIARMTDLLSAHGYVFINSPMHGTDEVFGEMIAAYLPEWQQAGKDVFWRHLHCDAKGWPLHGHLIWADPTWWETTFQRHGLVRDKEIEKVLHALLERFFETMAPARKSFFVLRRADFNPGIEDVRKSLKRVISPIVAELH